MYIYIYTRDASDGSHRHPPAEELEYAERIFFYNKVPNLKNKTAFIFFFIYYYNTFLIIARDDKFSSFSCYQSII